MEFYIFTFIICLFWIATLCK